MIEVTQTKFYPDGNCMAACLASILEKPLEEIPHTLGDNWLADLNEGLKKFGYKIDRTLCDPDDETVGGYHIAVIQSPRGNWLHACVALDGKIVWDPYPGADSSNAEILCYDILKKVDCESISN